MQRPVTPIFIGWNIQALLIGQLTEGKSVNADTLNNYYTISPPFISTDNNYENIPFAIVFKLNLVSE